MIGVFGGTFDPVHFGHLRPALEVSESLAFSDFRWVLAGQPPHRSGPVSATRHRLAMLRLAIDDVSGFCIDQRELERPGPSYMVDTLAELRAELGDQPLCLVIGQDNARCLASWSRWRELLSWAHLVVMRRPGLEADYPVEVSRFFAENRATDKAELLAELSGRVWHEQVSQLDISSSGIRWRRFGIRACWIDRSASPTR